MHVCMYVLMCHVRMCRVRMCRVCMCRVRLCCVRVCYVYVRMCCVHMRICAYLHMLACMHISKYAYGCTHVRMYTCKRATCMPVCV